MNSPGGRSQPFDTARKQATSPPRPRVAAGFRSRRLPAGPGFIKHYFEGAYESPSSLVGTGSKATSRPTRHQYSPKTEESDVDADSADRRHFATGTRGTLVNLEDRASIRPFGATTHNPYREERNTNERFTSQELRPHRRRRRRAGRDRSGRRRNSEEQRKHADP